MDLVGGWSGRDPQGTGWPELLGTRADVAWARTLRAETVAEIRKRLAVRRGGPADRTAVAALWTEVALRNTDARWWVDHRDHLTAALHEALTDADRVRLHRIQEGDLLPAARLGGATAA